MIGPKFQESQGQPWIVDNRPGAQGSGDSGFPSNEMTDVTRQLAHFIVGSRWEDIPQTIRHEALRAWLNWLGCALGGCHDLVVETALAVLRDFAGPAQATLLGRGERLDILNAALLNAISSNALDFDGTHLRTLIHPTVPVASASLALVEHASATGAQLLHAYVLGVETAFRIGNAVSPEHHTLGWEVTPRAIDGLIQQCWSLSQLRNAGALARDSVAAATQAARH